MRLALFQLGIFCLSNILAGLVLAAQSGVTSSVTSAATSQPAATRPSAGFAIVELFTSEGCSSCPPADAVLSEMTAKARKSGLQIFTLAFHVDYWDSASWKDRFSNASYSRRQADYAKTLKLANVYTPQTIVNGTTEFVGSDQKTAAAAVEAALAKTEPAQVKLKIAPSTNSLGTFHLDYAVSGADKHSVVNIAFVERGLSSKVTGGENGGRVLPHDNVVRWFNTEELTATGIGEVTVPHVEGLISKNASLIVYVQKSGNGAVVGAVSGDLP